MAIEVGGNRLYNLQRLGQSVWLDYGRPRTLAASQLARFIRDGISGVNIKPVGLATSCAEDGVYRELLAELRAAGAAADQIEKRIRIEELRRAADLLRRAYNTTGGRDGYVNIELSPALAHDADGTESEARHLWSMIDRPNVMLKVPATGVGLIAVRRLVAEGINVNATFIFGVRRYAEVVEAYLRGLEDRVAKRLPVDCVAPVASIFVNDIDISVDRQLDAIRHPWFRAERAKNLRDGAALAVAQFVYQKYRSMITSSRWRSLAASHAKAQRPLWAGTGSDATSEREVKYANELIGRDTVARLSLNTLSAYLDHRAAAPALERNLLQVIALFGELEALGIDLDRVSTGLENERIPSTVTGVDRPAWTL